MEGESPTFKTKHIYKQCFWKILNDSESHNVIMRFLLVTDMPCLCNKDFENLVIIKILTTLKTDSWAYSSNLGRWCVLGGKFYEKGALCFIFDYFLWKYFLKMQGSRLHTIITPNKIQNRPYINHCCFLPFWTMKVFRLKLEGWWFNPHWMLHWA